MSIVASIGSWGDLSVGLVGYDTEVDINLDAFEDKEHREHVRKELVKCFSEIWDDKAYVFFDDELEGEE